MKILEFHEDCWQKVQIINIQYSYYDAQSDLTANIYHFERMMMNTHESERSDYTNNTSFDRISSRKLKSSTVTSQILCKITFDLDDQSQELLVYDNTTLNELTENLVEKLKRSCFAHEENEYQITQADKAILKEQIKARIETTMEQNIEKSLQSAKWRNKLKEIIQQKVRTPMDSLVSPSSQRQTPTESKSVSYFKYNFPQSQNDQSYKQRQIIERMKILDKEINKQVKTKDEKKNRLYDLGKQTNLLRDYISKIHEYETKQEELSECTFHPFVKKNHQSKEFGSIDHQGQDVFKRLYNEALEKKEKMKKIQVEVQNRQIEEYKHLNFIPQINECSKEIIRAKNDQKTSIYQNLYKDVYHKDRKKKFEPQWTFHPTICAKSDKMVKKNQSIKTSNKQGIYASKPLLRNLNQMKNESSIDNQKNGLKTEHSHSRSPLLKKNMSTKKLDNYKISRTSEACIKQTRNEEDTLKKISYKPNIYNESQSTLKQNIFSKKAFKKSNKDNNQSKQNLNLAIKNQTLSNYFVDSKDIKRQKIIISEQTYETCNTEETNPIYLANYHDSVIKEESQLKNLKNKSKSTKLNPFAFFQQRQKEKKKVNSINNKQNQIMVKHHRQQEKGIQQEFLRRKSKIFEDIFDFLLKESQGQDEIFSEAIIDSCSIPQTLKHIFNPMAEQMMQLNVGLDKQQFVWSMTRIFDSLTLQQRGWILAWGLKLQEPIVESLKNYR